MIDIILHPETRSILKTVDLDRSMLITGNAKTNHAVNQIVYYDSPETVTNLYKECDLSKAFSMAKEIGAPHVFVANIKRNHDYIDLANVLRQYDFSYITPTDIYFSDHFFDATRNNKKITYCQHLLEKMSSSNHSTIIATDKHASLYEEIDAYLDEMGSLVQQFKNTLTANMNGKNLCFVLNNLREHALANVVLASVLCASNVGVYPRHMFGPAVFNMDAFDMQELEMAFFKNHHNNMTTVENLLNFHGIRSPEKIVTIDRIVKHIKRKLDLSLFHGRPLTVYQKLQVEKVVVEYMDSLVGSILRDYNVQGVRLIKEAAGAGRIEIELNIWPVNSTERFSVVVEG